MKGMCGVEARCSLSVCRMGNFLMRTTVMTYDLPLRTTSSLSSPGSCDAGDNFTEWKQQSRLACSQLALNLLPSYFVSFLVCWPTYIFILLTVVVLPRF